MLFNNRDLTKSRRSYLELLKMTFFSDVLLMSVLVTFIIVTKKIYGGINVSVGKHTNMASFREARFQLLNAFSDFIINDG